ncbi:MAG: hypothetical protein QF733_09725 [Phycisphaerales bacterium]|jgi:hypothetical protein|nr:hypothetical protein [Phycisphaerales bacterium]
MHESATRRIEALERRVRWQGRAVLAMSGLAVLAGLAAFQQPPAKPTKVVLEQPIKVILEDIGSAIRFNHPIPIRQK